MDIAPHLSSIVELDMGVAGKLRHEWRRACPASCLLGNDVDDGEMSSSPSLSLAMLSGESWSQGHESRRTGHVFYQLQHSEEQDLHFTWAAE